MKIQLNIENLIEKLSFANTPAYLYKHFKQDDSIYDFSKLYTTEELIAFLRNRFNNITTIDDLAIIYAIIFALMFKPNKEVNDFFVALRKSELKWADKISEFYFLNNSIENIEYTFHVSDDSNERKTLKSNEPTFYISY